MAKAAKEIVAGKVTAVVTDSEHDTSLTVNESPFDTEGVRLAAESREDGGKER
ncbi:hypothetical protein AB0M44_28455 [Streptosporangium subroseum]|uniref:hypothetical protein n=1 Tax=Streptosporangium subroseum TaxID=106412 RepID=UPI00342B9FD3